MSTGRFQGRGLTLVATLLGSVEEDAGHQWSRAPSSSRDLLSEVAHGADLMPHPQENGETVWSSPRWDGSHFSLEAAPADLSRAVEAAGEEGPHLWPGRDKRDVGVALLATSLDAAVASSLVPPTHVAFGKDGTWHVVPTSSLPRHESEPGGLTWRANPLVARVPYLPLPRGRVRGRPNGRCLWPSRTQRSSASSPRGHDPIGLVRWTPRDFHGSQRGTVPLVETTSRPLRVSRSASATAARRSARDWVVVFRGTLLRIGELRVTMIHEQLPDHLRPRPGID